jgi:hypothetical protein
MSSAAAVAWVRLLAAALLCFAAALASAPAASQPGPRQLLPVDEAASQPEFFAFRARLAAVVARRDTAALLTMIDKDVHLGFGGEAGHRDLQKTWQPAARHSKLWDTLATILALGGSFDGADHFEAPYVFSRWPKDLDAFEHLAVVGHQVRLRAAPSTDAAVLATVDFAVLERAGPDAGGWVPVKASGGAKAFVARAFVRSPLEHRLIFGRVDGRWMVTALVAGD